MSRPDLSLVRKTQFSPEVQLKVNLKADNLCRVTAYTPLRLSVPPDVAYLPARSALVVPLRNPVLFLEARFEALQIHRNPRAGWPRFC